MMGAEVLDDSAAASASKSNALTGSGTSVIFRPFSMNSVSFMADSLGLGSSVAVPVGECLGDDPSNWYRAGR